MAINVPPATSTHAAPTPSVMTGRLLPPSARDWAATPPAVDYHDIPQLQFCHECGAIPDLLPFENRHCDPATIMAAVQGFLDERPITSSSFTGSHVSSWLRQGGEPVGWAPTDIDSIDPALVTRMETPMLLLGAFPKRDTQRYTQTRYVNPRYVHATTFDPITDRNERMRWLQRYASLGVVDFDQIAPQFGYETGEAVSVWVESVGYPWDAWRDYGRRRMARTLHLMTAPSWTNRYSIETAAAMVGLDPMTVREWIAQHSAAYGFRPPADPTQEAYRPPPGRTPVVIAESTGPTPRGN